MTRFLAAFFCVVLGLWFCYKSGNRIGEHPIYAAGAVVGALLAVGSPIVIFSGKREYYE